MIVTDFHERLTAFVKEAVQEELLPVRPSKQNPTPSPVPAEVYKGRLPDSKSWQSKAPYILVQIVGWKDYQYEGQRPEAACTVRIVFVAYSQDESEGVMYVENMIQRVRERILRFPIIGNQYKLILEEGMEAAMYDGDTAPYYGGELESVWKIPTVRMESRPWLDNVTFPLSPNYSG